MHLRFWSKVDFSGPNGCWEWTASTHGGYGEFSLSNPDGRSAHKTVWAHRMAYEYLRGPIPDGLVIDHLCRNRKCVNPAHMEVVSRGENVRRGNEWRRRQKAMSDISWDVEEFWLRQDTPQPPPLWKEEAVVPTDEDTEQGSQ